MSRTRSTWIDVEGSAFLSPDPPAKLEQVGWAYWLKDHWHLCVDEPVAHDTRKPIYIKTISRTDV